MRLTPPSYPVCAPTAKPIVEKHLKDMVKVGDYRGLCLLNPSEPSVMTLKFLPRHRSNSLSITH